MKIALYIDNGLEQIVLTPETKTEDGIIGKMHDGTRDVSVYRGGFYACAGGWTRHKDNSTSDSTIIVLRPKPQ